ncbi:hypothetical protein GALL_106780 [mine drainage metagenome]|uniref:2-hydroxylaminobenzoate mutase n=1 Tax=mine drainage metagenome TaxID=410659 RepID=A0A1J5SGQ4_9ZZZZ
MSETKPEVASLATPESFSRLISQVTRKIAGRPLDAALAGFLEAEFPASGAIFQDIFEACQAGIEAGWMCAREAGGIKYGRVLKPTAATDGFSVDVVEMEEVAGPHHRHPKGEIDMIMPLAGTPKFDGHGRGWFVYGPGSAHPPTVAGGRALVLYLLPDGAIEFTKPAN